MSRSDQFIGLTNSATQYLDSLNTKIMYPYAIVDYSETLTGEQFNGIYAVIPIGDDYTKEYILREVLQTTIWDSGPMYFTCLELTQVKPSGHRVRIGNHFQWSYSPKRLIEGKDSVLCDYDRKAGFIYVG